MLYAAPTMMRAIRYHAFGGPEQLRLESIETPQPAPGEVLVRVQAAGVNPVETYIRAGTYPRKPSLPYVPGSDGAGDIEAVGSESGKTSKKVVIEDCGEVKDEKN